LELYNRANKFPKFTGCWANVEVYQVYVTVPQRKNVVFGSTIYSKTIVFLNVPIPLISTSTWSPCFKKDGGFMNNPTPPGVPVMNTVLHRVSGAEEMGISSTYPFSRVWPWLQNAINFLTPKHKSEICPT
jgi:hypothetical protein